MAVDHVKSASITNSDASPAVANTAGEGGAAPLKSITGIATGVASSSIDATYQMVRVPSNAKIKRITLQSQSQAVGVADVGLYYATDGVIGKPTALLAAAAIDQDFFATAISLVTVQVQPTDVTNNPITTAYTPDKRNMPLWQAAGLTSDPGGNFDICLTLTTAITTGTGKMVMEVAYTD
jgi:hypothetical protein